MFIIQLFFVSYRTLVPAVIYKDLHSAVLARTKVTKVLLCDIFIKIPFLRLRLKARWQSSIVSGLFYCIL